MKRFEIWTADMPFTNGSKLKCGRRPVVIVSDQDDADEMPFVSVVPLTKNLTACQLATHVLLRNRYLDLPSRALCEQVTTVDKSRLVRRIGYVDDAFDRFALNRALSIQLHLVPTQMIFVQEDSENGYFWNA